VNGTGFRGTAICAEIAVSIENDIIQNKLESLTDENGLTNTLVFSFISVFLN